MNIKKSNKQYKPLKILISSRAGFSNKGDDAILLAMISIFKSVIPGIEIVSLSTHPEITSREYGVPAIWNIDITTELKMIRKCGLIVIGGGGLIQDIYSNAPIYIPTCLHTVFLAKLFKKPVVYYALGVGPIKNRIGRKIIKIASENVDMITVRDEESKKNLIDFGVTKKIKVLRDPVFFLNASDENRVYEILNNEGIKKSKKPLFALSVRPKDIDVDIISSAMDGIVDKLNVDVILIPTDPKKDVELAENISNKMKHSAYILRGDYDPRELLGIMGCVDLMIGMRFHSLVMATVMNVPIVGIEYEPKIKSFARYMDLPKSIPVESISTENLLNQVEYVWTNRENISKKNSERVELFRKEILEINKEVLSYRDKNTIDYNKFDFTLLLFLLLITYFYIMVMIVFELYKKPKYWFSKKIDKMYE